MSTETAARDPNYVTTLMGVDLTTGLLPTKVYVDETTHRLLVNSAVASFAPLLAGEDLTADRLKVEQRNSFSNITTNTTTTVKSGSGLLHSISVNNPAAITVTALTMTIYDNTAASGTKIGTFTVPLLTTAEPFSIPFDAAFAVGLTVVTAGPTVAADITVNYR
jgi:hypothetical protein